MRGVKTRTLVEEQDAYKPKHQQHYHDRHLKAVSNRPTREQLVSVPHKVIVHTDVVHTTTHRTPQGFITFMIIKLLLQTDLVHAAFVLLEAPASCNLTTNAGDC